MTIELMTLQQKRFFATLQFARTLKTTDTVLKDLVLRAYHYGFTCGWQQNIK